MNNPTIARVETVEELNALPPYAVYVSDSHGVAEQRLTSSWFAAGCNKPYEPELPGTAFIV